MRDICQALSNAAYVDILNEDIMQDGAFYLAWILVVGVKLTLEFLAGNDHLNDPVL